MDHLVTADWQIEPVDSGHQRDRFSCGEPALDDFIRTKARKHREQNISATFVAVAPGSRVVGGYYTLAERMIELVDLPAAAVKRLPRHPVPAILLGRFAVDLAHQGKGLGKLLLVDALRTCVAAAELVGVFAVVLDAKNAKVKAWYEHHGFTPFPSTPLRLFITVDAIRRRM